MDFLREQVKMARNKIDESLPEDRLRMRISGQIEKAIANKLGVEEYEVTRFFDYLIGITTIDQYLLDDKNK